MALQLNGTTKIVNDNLNTEVKTLLTPKNWIINGGFDVWQRGTSQTSSGYGSADRWFNVHSVSTKTVSRQTFTVGQTDVPNNPTYFKRTIVSSGNTPGSNVRDIQRIEDITKLAGKTISLSFWAKADASKNMSVGFDYIFGSGGSTQINAVSVQKFSLTTSWQQFTATLTLPSISGKTIGTDNYLQLVKWFDAGSDFNSQTDNLGNQSGTFDTSSVSLVEGSTPVEWQTEAYADVLDKCLDYYRVFRHSSNYIWLASGLFVNSTYGNIMLPIGRPMRSTSISVEWSNIHLTDMYSLGQVATAITAIAVIGSVVYIQVTDAGGHTIGRAAFIGTHVGGGYIAFSAEL